MTSTEPNSYRRDRRDHQAVPRRAGARQGVARLPAGRSPCRRRRKRRRQVDLDEHTGRRPAADRGRTAYRRQARPLPFGARQPGCRHRRRLPGAGALPHPQRRREHHDVDDPGQLCRCRLVPRAEMRRQARAALARLGMGDARSGHEGLAAFRRRDAAGRDRRRHPPECARAGSGRAELGAFAARERAPVRDRQAVARRGRHRHLRVASSARGSRHRRPHHGDARRPRDRDARQRQCLRRPTDPRHGRARSRRTKPWALDPAADASGADDRALGAQPHRARPGRYRLRRPRRRNPRHRRASGFRQGRPRRGAVRPGRARRKRPHRRQGIAGRAIHRPRSATAWPSCRPTGAAPAGCCP